MCMTKPYRIYNCDSTNSENTHNPKDENNEGKNGNRNGNGNEVLKFQGLINRYGNLTSTGGHGGAAIATSNNTLALATASISTAIGGAGGFGGAITPINPVTNVPVSFLDGSFNGNLNGLLNDNLSDNLNDNFSDNLKGNFSENKNSIDD
ncbi:hypothetical protein ACQKP0_11905 [Heyndrickxia sp. NPDC080065]|uniref:hypothetical protein n=1 Tax=Heyndrickxia sp. NPDC080065 TaxID=3390568 RepID=UPI003D01123F